MISIQDIIAFENHHVRSFATATERSYGVLFHNRDNPTSHDSNHALIMYLYASDPGALRIYHEAGFRKLDWKPYKWSAWLE